MKYLPFLNGIYTTAPGLIQASRQANAEDKIIFQIDDLYGSYIENKGECRRENMKKYYAEHEFNTATSAAVNHYIASQLQKEHPAFFDYDETGKRCIFINLKTGDLIQWHKETLQLTNDKYLSLFDALCSQVQEDVAVCQLHKAEDWLSAIHLCAPNHWAATDKIGKPFDAVHAPVPGMEKTFNQYVKMLQTVVSKGAFTRYAWGISTDKRLNHHPDAPAGLAPEKWKGRKIDEQAQLFIRTEKQCLIGFPRVNAFLFTIRTYFYEVALLENHEKIALWSAIRSMSPKALEYKGLTGLTDFLSRNLFEEP